MNNTKITNKPLLENIKTLLQTSRQHLQQTVNTTMVQTYWNIGRLIVKDERESRVWKEAVRSYFRNFNTRIW